jgi:hypothetical protein
VASRLRALIVGSLVAASMALAGIASPVAVVAAGEDGAGALVAYLDGREIPLEDVSRYFCDDFEYPVVRCSASRLTAEVRATVAMLLTSVDYVTIYEQAFFGGTWMNVSQDYAMLVLIGWSDEISSFKGRNSETGRFYTDWFYGGTTWSFCCNQQVSSLGAYDNTFSSVRRT